MSRLGMNPGRGKASAYRPARVTAAVLVHIPHFSGYFEGRFPVLIACLTSLVENTAVPLDLLVFDNGSCTEVQEYLRELQGRGVIQLLLASGRNLGKAGALRLIFGAAPGELVAYCDDDFYFFPGWLEAQLEILDTFPKVGMVSGYAIPSLFAPQRISAALEFGRSRGVELKAGKFIAGEWIRDWALSTGRRPDQEIEAAATIEEFIVEYKGLSAFAAANHDQFLAPREVIRQCLPAEWSGQLMGGMLEMDEAVNRAGYLRLGTRLRTAQHLGNRLSEELAAGLPASIGTANMRRPGSAGSPRWWRQFLRWRPVRSILLGIYSRLFHLINPE
jgi:glycosyltransferase involved in cell wall biosynthesis